MNNSHNTPDDTGKVDAEPGADALGGRNLISGVTDAAEPESSPEKGSAPVSGNTSDGHPRTEAEADRTDSLMVERIAERVVSLMDDRMAEAEKRGYQKAVDEARAHPENLGIDTTVPNFLLDVRPDVWES